MLHTKIIGILCILCIESTNVSKPLSHNSILSIKTIFCLLRFFVNVFSNVKELKSTIAFNTSFVFSLEDKLSKSISIKLYALNKHSTVTDLAQPIGPCKNKICFKQRLYSLFVSNILIHFLI